MPQLICRTGGRPVPLGLIALVLVGAALEAGPKFLNLYKAPDVARLNFAGKKIAAVVMTDDQSLQISAEEALARELSARGVSGVPSYRMMPREEMKSAEKARVWFERAATQGVVAFRPVGVRQEQRPSAMVWTSGYYNSFWSYYGYGWGTTYAVPLSYDKSTTVSVETLVYDLTGDKLVWAATSETEDPKNLQHFVADLVKAAVEEMKKNKLVG